jgi:hypothetical protein
VEEEICGQLHHLTSRQDNGYWDKQLQTKNSRQVNPLLLEQGSNSYVDKRVLLGVAGPSFVYIYRTQHSYIPNKLLGVPCQMKISHLNSLKSGYKYIIQ